MKKNILFVLIMTAAAFLSGCAPRWYNYSVSPYNMESQLKIDHALCTRYAYQSLADSYVDSLPKYAMNSNSLGAFLEGFNKGLQKQQEMELARLPHKERSNVLKAIYEGCMTEKGWIKDRKKGIKMRSSF